MAERRRLEARYSAFHNFSMAIVAFGMIVVAGFYIGRSDAAPSLSLNDPRFVLLLAMGVAMAYYGSVGLKRALDRSPQVTIDENGIALGFGRNRRFSWDEITWIKLHRLAVRPMVQIGVLPQSFLGASLGLSFFNLDDPLRPIRGMPSAFALRDNGLDTKASALLDAIRAYRPDLVRS
ncbi:MAG TPA: hypothetical protein VEC14_03225 [Reyranellaceae bacterium]|nr:hypothetical protein [Reyranellaceae bacterium]